MGRESDAKKVQEAAEKLLMQAHQSRREKRYSDAKRNLLKAVNLCQKAGIRFTLAQTLAMLGQIERDEQQIDSALSNYKEALKIFREIGNRNKVAHTVRHIADIHRSSRRLQSAEHSYNEALEIYRSNSQTKPLDLANAIRGLAILKGEMNSPDESRLLWEEAKELYDAVNVTQGVEECKQRIADLDSLPN